MGWMSCPVKGKAALNEALTPRPDYAWAAPKGGAAATLVQAPAYLAENQRPGPRGPAMPMSPLGRQRPARPRTENPEAQPQGSGPKPAHKGLRAPPGRSGPRTHRCQNSWASSRTGGSPPSWPPASSRPQGPAPPSSPWPSFPSAAQKEKPGNPPALQAVGAGSPKTRAAGPTRTTQRARACPAPLVHQRSWWSGRSAPPLR